MTFKKKGYLAGFDGFGKIHSVSCVFCSKMPTCSLKVFEDFGSDPLKVSVRAPPCQGRCAAETFERV